jgi:hypothetical protein
MSAPVSSESSAPDIPPPIGAAPENEDFSHPWIISGIVSTICFGLGFALLYSTGAWHNVWQWADGPFMFYLAILAPVLVGFYAYGIYLLVNATVRLFRSK